MKAFCSRAQYYSYHIWFSVSQFTVSPFNSLEYTWRIQLIASISLYVELAWLLLSDHYA